MADFLATPGERLFGFSAGRIASCVGCATTPHTASPSIFLNEKLLCSWRFETRALAIQWTEQERFALDADPQPQA
jgi:hypothetical protein